MGTTHSGFAFSFNNNEGEDTIFLNPEWKSDLGYQTSKTPSCLLLKPDLTFDSFGYKAAEKYAYVKDVFNTWKKFLFFENLKISLDEGEVRSLPLFLNAQKAFVKVMTPVSSNKSCVR